MKNKLQHLACAVAAACATMAAATDAAASTYRYNAPTGGDWNVPANWTIDGSGLTGVPGAGDLAYLGYAGAGLFLVSYFGSPNAADRLQLIQLDALGAGTTMLQVSASTLNTVGVYLGGNTGPGQALIVQDFDSTVDISLDLYIGAGSAGRYELLAYSPGQQPTLHVANNLFLGMASAGEFIQNGGTHNANRMVLANNASGSGRYDLIAGTLNVGSIARGAGSSRLNLDGGTLNLTGTSIDTGTFAVGSQAGRNGVFTLAAGQTLTSSVSLIGEAGSGTVTQTGGSHVAANSMVVGSAGAGTYTLSGGILTTPALQLATNGGDGTFDQSGGSVVADSLYMAAAGTATYHLSGGQLTVGSALIGDLGVAHFNQSGGTHTVHGDLQLGWDGGQGTYTLSAGSLVVDGNLWRGTGTSRFNLDGGALTLGGTDIDVGVFALGSALGSDGSLTLAAGQTLTSFVSLVGEAGAGTVTQTGGLHHATNSMVIGSGGPGIYHLSGGNLVTPALQFSTNGGDGTFDQTGGTVVTNSLYMATAGTVTYHLSGGQLTAISALVGDSGVGHFIQSGGSHTVHGDLGLGWDGGQGTYTLSGGQLVVDGNVAHGNGSSRLNVDGGTLSVAGNISVKSLVLGSAAGSSGGFTLASGHDLTTDTTLVGLGSGASGHLVQTGGAHQANNVLVVGSGSTGYYDLSGGSLDANVLQIGISGDGSVTQSGGTVLTSSLYMGLAAFGGYALSGGSLAVIGDATVGDTAGASYYQTGGTALFEGVVLGQGAGGTGQIDLIGGTLSVLGIAHGSGNSRINIDGGSFELRGTDIAVGTFALGSQPGSQGQFALAAGQALTTTVSVVGWDGAGTLDQTGGAHAVGNLLLIGGNAGAHGIYNLSGGSANVNFMVVGDAGTGSVQQSGGTLVTGGLVLSARAGGQGSYTLSGGSLTAGQFSLYANGPGNAASFVQTGGMAVAQDFEVNGNASAEIGNGQFHAQRVSTDAGGQVTQNGGELAVAQWLSIRRGSFDLNGGSLSADTLELIDSGGGSGSFNQSAGSSSVNALNVASGSVNLHGGTMTVASSLVNQGTVYLGGAGHLLGAGSLYNAGQFTADADLSNTGGFSNDGLYQQRQGTLALGFTGGNVNSGLLTVASTLRLGTDAVLVNQGSLALDGAIVSGPGRLVNEFGGTLTGSTVINSGFSNDGGLLRVTGATRVSQAFGNLGAIQLAGGAANLTGGTIANAGSIEGAGQVSNSIDNAGTIEALGGTLTLGGVVSNGSGGVLSASSGNKLLVARGLASNQGVINLTGGTFDNNNQALTNAGQITGAGTLRSGGLVNDGQLALSFGNSSVSGAIDNRATGSVVVSNGAQASFAGNLVNNGELRISAGGAANFFGVVSGGGAFGGDGEARFEGGFAPGNSPALVTLGFRASYSSGSTITMELGGTAPGNCDTCADKIIFNNTVTLQGGALDIVWWSDNRGQGGDVYDLFDWNGTLTGTFGSISLPALGNGLSWQTASLYTTGEISITAVPEPGTYALLLAGLALVGTAARRRKAG